ncbi:hypothetical protein ACEV6Q_04160 [Enterobacter ludwigii]|uniref:hypothetical protein n=1 Tax=Enterobacter ludwigii TaxID=299767 RepID=UPI003BEEFDA7
MYGYLKDEKQYLNWLRSSLRKVWCKHPVKLSMLQERRVRQKNSTGKMIWHYQCEHCSDYFKSSEIEVNHKNTVGTLTLNNFGVFAERMLLVKEDDLELLCHKCHGLITYQERYGVSKRDADIAKRVIAFSKLTAAEQTAKLLLAKIEIPKPNNSNSRKDCVRKYLEEKLP